MRRIAVLSLLTFVAVLLDISPVPAKERPPGEEYRNTKVLVVNDFKAVNKVGAKAIVTGFVQPGYRFSEAILVTPDGDASVVDDVKIDDSAFKVTLRLARGKGIYRLELTGTTDKDRTHSGARILLFAGVPEDHADEPLPEDVLPDKRLPGEALAVDLFRRVNAHRKSLRLKPLKWQEPLAQAARKHAQECLTRGKLDHKFPGVGTLAERVTAEYGWQRMSYKRPGNPPSRDKQAKSHLATLLDARKGLEPILHRWRRFSAFCLPMTSELMTHAACGIARAKHGSCYVVFVFAQINGTQIDKLSRGMQAAAVREVTSGITTDEERPVRLRELGLWLDKTAATHAKKHARSKDAALRGAALDVQLLLEPDDTRAMLEKGLDAAGREYAAAAGGTRPGNRHLKLLQAARHLRYAPDLLDRAATVEALRAKAALAALVRARSLPESEAVEAALVQLRKDYPGTPAAIEAAAGK